MKGYSIEYKLVSSIYGIEYKVVTSIILHLEYKWSTIIVLQSRHTRGGGINIIYSIASIMVYQYRERIEKGLRYVLEKIKLANLLITPILLCLDRRFL